MVHQMGNLGVHRKVQRGIHLVAQMGNPVCHQKVLRMVRVWKGHRLHAVVCWALQALKGS